MRSGVVKASELGNCWSAHKHLSNCVGCDKYQTCRYPDRKHDRHYDHLLAKKEKVRKRLGEVNQEIADYERR